MPITVAGPNITMNDSTVQTTAFIGFNGQIFTSSGSFIIPSGVSAMKVTVVGGGGNGTSTNSATFSGGGGGGGTAIAYLTGLTPGVSVSVTVGGVTGTTSFGAFCSATGGANSGIQNTPPNSASASTTSAAGGVGTGGALNITGGAGAVSSVVSVLVGCAYVLYPTIGGGGTAGGAPGAYSDGQPGLFSGAAGGPQVSASGYGNGAGGNFTTGATKTGTGGIVIIEW
jgi:hypothetical protein